MSKSIKRTAVEALGSRVIISRDIPETVTEGGIILHESSQLTSEKGTVLGVGEDCLHLKQGDRVLIPSMCGTPIAKDKGKEVLVMLEEEVMVRFNE